MVQTVLLEAFRSWFLELDQADARAVMNALLWEEHLAEVAARREEVRHKKEGKNE